MYSQTPWGDDAASMRGPDVDAATPWGDDAASMRGLDVDAAASLRDDAASMRGPDVDAATSSRDDAVSMWGPDTSGAGRVMGDAKVRRICDRTNYMSRAVRFVGPMKLCRMRCVQVKGPAAHGTAQAGQTKLLKTSCPSDSVRTTRTLVYL